MRQVPYRTTPAFREASHFCKWGKRGQERKIQYYSERNITLTSSECRNTRCIVSGLTLKSILRGQGTTEKSWRLVDTRATLTDSGSLCCSRKAENSTSLSLVVPIDRPCHAGTEGAGADVGSNPKIKGTIFMKKLIIPQFMFSELNIIGNYACSPWMFILISANNEFRMS